MQDSFEDAFSSAFDDEDINDDDEPKSEGKKKDTEDKKVKNKKLSLNETIKTDEYEFTITGFDFGKKITPPNTNEYYTYYEAKEDGHQYLDIKMNYKNLEGSGVEADSVASVKIKYDNKYEYNAFSVIVDSDGDFTYSSITEIDPLTVGQLHFLVDIPDVVADSGKPVKAFITVGSIIYELDIK